jgi:hypothetical protein
MVPFDARLGSPIGRIWSNPLLPASPWAIARRLSVGWNASTVTRPIAGASVLICVPSALKRRTSPGNPNATYSPFGEYATAVTAGGAAVATAGKSSSAAERKRDMVSCFL